MHKVACIRVYDAWNDYGDSSNNDIAVHVTDFMEVDDATLANLRAAANDYDITRKLGYSFRVMEQVPESEVLDTIAQYVALANKRAAAEAKRKAEEAKRRAEAQAKKAKTSIAKKKQMLAKLQEELASLETTEQQ